MDESESERHLAEEEPEKQIDEEEKAIVHNMSCSAQSEIEKGRHVRTQLSLWDTLLDTRVRLQETVTAANRLPPRGLFPAFLQEEEVSAAVAEAKKEIRGLFAYLAELQAELVEQNKTLGIEKARRKRKLDEICEEEGHLKDIWDHLQEFNDDFLPFRNDNLETWSAKVQFTAASGRGAKKLKALDQSVVTQISQALRDRERLIKRTRLVRFNGRRLGALNTIEEARNQQQQSGSHQQTEATTDEHLKNTDDEVFDDTDFYQQMLKELIESKVVDTDDPIAQGIRWASLRGKLAQSGKSTVKQHRPGVDVRASKGRKLRFEVQDKLVGFMAPVHNAAAADIWHEERMNELFASLLGGVPGQVPLVQAPAPVYSTVP